MDFSSEKIKKPIGINFPIALLLTVFRIKLNVVKLWTFFSIQASNNFVKKLISTSILLVILIFPAGCGPSSVVVRTQPPPPVYVRPIAPGANYVWVDGNGSGEVMAMCTARVTGPLPMEDITNT